MNTYCVTMLTFEEGFSDEITQKTHDGLFLICQRIVVAPNEVEAEGKYLKHILESKAKLPDYYIVTVDNKTEQYGNKDDYVLI
jgi:hypothetical protein